MDNIVIYTYVDDMAERRGPHRPGHLDHIQTAKQAGSVIMAGGTGDPVTGGAIVFRGTTPEEIEAWVGEDPYRSAGLVTAYRIEPWALV